ncbi:hypothetical protein ACVIJ6_002852 [Bradyrhizobium sp. USDA 4369]
MKTRILPPFIVVLVVIAIGLAGSAYAIWSFMEEFGACETVEEESIPAPDGKSRIVVFSRACNATVPTNRQASISPNAGQFSLEKNPPFVVVTRSSFRAVWLSNDRIEIDLPEDAAVRRREPRVDDITIEYR